MEEVATPTQTSTQKSTLKSGFKTTEFWLTVIGGVTIIVGGIVQAIPEDKAVMGTALVMLYNILRGIPKIIEAKRG